jgi:cell division septum initiation protein DivIVA
MTTTDVQKDAVAAASKVDDSAAGPDPSKQAESAAHALLAKARYDAFKLVTDARSEAESVLDEARTEADAIIKEATVTAEGLHDAAKLQADQFLTAATAEREASREIVDQAEATESSEALEAEHVELTQKVGSLRSLADQLEERFAALAAAADRGDDTETIGTTDETPAAVVDYEPTVTAPSTESDRAEPEERGSFYSRRSANLPRIGDAAGQSALDMMRSIRESSEKKEA